MATAATNAATAPKLTPRVPPLSGTWTIEQRRFLGFIGIALCVGVIIGNKIGRGATPMTAPAQPGPCADCAERTIQEQRIRDYVARQPPMADRPLPGDVPPVAFTPGPPQPAGQGAASLDISGAIVDTSKSVVKDASYGYTGGGEGVPQ